MPTRLFHWILFFAVIALFATGYTGQMHVHFLIGKITLTLVLFRLVWGVVGSRTARFSDFLAGPAALLRYLKSYRSDTLGHTP